MVSPVGELAVPDAASWKVELMLPTAQFTQLARYFIGFAARLQGVHAPAGLIGSGAEKLMRLIFRGLPVGGELKVDAAGIEFTPTGYLQTLAFEDLPVFTIPASDIEGVELPHWLMRVSPDPRARYIRLETSSGTVYLRNRAFLGSNQEIVNAIRALTD